MPAQVCVRQTTTSCNLAHRGAVCAKSHQSLLSPAYGESICIDRHHHCTVVTACPLPGPNRAVCLCSAGTWSLCPIHATLWKCGCPHTISCVPADCLPGPSLLLYPCRQGNRGYEGLTISPDGKTICGIMQVRALLLVGCACIPRAC